MLLACSPQLGGGGRWRGAGVVPGLLLGQAGLAEHAVGSLGLGERVRYVRGAGGGGERSAAFGQAGFGGGQVVPVRQGVGAPPLPVGEAPGLALPVEHPVEVLPVGGDLALAGGGFGGRGPGQLVRPPGVRQGLGVGRLLAWDRDASGLGDPGQEPGNGDLGVPDLVRRGLAAAGEPLLDGVEPVGSEQPLQQLGPVAGVGVQEPGELPLGQQHDLEELVRGHPHQVGDLGVRLPSAGGDGLPGRAGELLEQDLRLLGGGAGAAELGALLLGLAGDPHQAAADGGLEPDLGRRARSRVIRAQPPGLAALAGDPAVQREPDGVEQGGLARARLAVQQEQPG